MTDPDHQQLDDLAKATVTIFGMLEEETYFLAQTHADNPSIPPGLVAVLTITLKHDQPPQHPLFDAVWKVPQVVAP